MKISRQRVRPVRPISSRVRSYLVVAGILLAFLLGLFALVAVELLLVG